MCTWVRMCVHLWVTGYVCVDVRECVCPIKHSRSSTCTCAGHKTASVVMSQAYNHSAFPVDTHIHR